MTTRRILSGALIAAAFAMAGATLAQQGPPPGGGGGPPGGGPPRGGGGGGGFVISTSMLVESNSFPDGGIIPAKNSMNGGGVQPDFKITGIPATAQSVALIFHDIEIVAGSPADDNLHWIAWNIPVVNGTAILEEGKLPEGAMGKGSRGAAFMGPGAPAGVRYHHYVFDFFALSSKIEMPATGLRPELIAAMTGKVVGKASYIGRFKGEARAGGPGPGGGAPGGGAPGGGRPGGGGPGAGGPPPGAGF